ncbi:MAG TPA: hypothetical protein VKP61_12240 [Candidatus Acidoferrum sp.]|nr:hypothetical protein [Candidatus Acidoferrum sp.]
MSNEEVETRKCLSLAFEHLRALHATLTAEMTDIAALRRAVLNNPRLLRRYQVALTQEVRVAKPLVVAAMQAYDEAILRVMTNGDLRN